MKYTGIVRNIDDLGRVTLPMELRKVRDIKEGDPIEIYVDGDVICLKPAVKKKCFVCGTTEQLLEIDGLHICQKCGYKIIDKIAED